VGKMRVLGSPQKMPSMTGYDLEVTGCQPMHGEANCD
jgi:3,4-dihydroxy 2-butanone 4-phosphate synthase/GTP cyclohydrolase II